MVTIQEQTIATMYVFHYVLNPITEINADENMTVISIIFGRQQQMARVLCPVLVQTTNKSSKMFSYISQEPTETTILFVDGFHNKQSLCL